jgi:cytochrome P450
MNHAVPRIPGHFLFGSLPAFKNDRVNFLTSIPERYGDQCEMRLGLFFRVIVTSSPELAREILIEQEDAFVKSFGLTVFARPLLGNGLLTSEGDVHRRQRRLSAPAFMKQRISRYANTIAEFTDRHVERLRGTDQVDLSEEMMRLTFEIVGKTLFNADVSGDVEVVEAALTAAMENLMAQTSSLLPLPQAVPSPANLRVKRLVDKLDDVMYRLIRDRRASKNDEGDFLSMLLIARDEDGTGAMTDRQVRDEAMTILLAGHETTANALAWTFYLLAQNPDVRDRLHAEVDAILGGRRPTLDDLPHLPYSLQVFKEAMRLYPPAYMMLRRATRPVTIGKVDLRKGDMVLVDIIGMHRRADYFANPTRFDPDRFAPEAEKKLPKHAYLPFGAGPRICIGNHFALMEGQIALAHLAQHLSFDLVPGRDVVVPEPLITLRPRGGLPMRVRSRAAVVAALAPDLAALA